MVPFLLLPLTLLLVSPSPIFCFTIRRNRVSSNHLWKESDQPVSRQTPVVDTLVSHLQSSSTSWNVYVDQSKSSLDKGATATLDAFLSLSPSASVKVQGALLNKSKAKGPSVRCISSSNSFDVGNVDSVDKVTRILRRHMGIPGISLEMAECLKYKYLGTAHLEAGRVDRALECYNRAISMETPQEGRLLLMRATAYLQRAAAHRIELKKIVKELTEMVHMDELKVLCLTAADEPTLAQSIFRRILQDTSIQENQFRNTQFRHGLYQYALLQAAQDSLQATQLLPDNPEAWRRAAEILSELWKLRESAQYYQRAAELDSSSLAELTTIMEQLQGRQELLDNASAYGWSEDTLRLALDVAR